MKTCWPISKLDHTLITVVVMQMRRVRFCSFDYSLVILMLYSDLAIEPVVGVAEKVYEWRVAVQ